MYLTYLKNGKTYNKFELLCLYSLSAAMKLKINKITHKMIITSNNFCFIGVLYALGK